MCKAKTEGSRCSYHTRIDLQAAAIAYHQFSSTPNWENLQDKRAEHAATPGGREELEARLRELSPDTAEAVDVEMALHRGAEIRDRRKGVDAALKAKANRKVARPDLGSRDEQIALTMDPKAKPEDLERIYRNGDTALRYHALTHPNATIGMLSEAAKDPELAIVAAHHDNATGPILDHLAGHEDPEVRIAVLHNPNTTRATLQRLVRDKDEYVRTHAAGLERLPMDGVYRLASDRSVKVRKAVAKRSDLTSGQEERLADDPALAVQTTLAQHTRRPEIQERLATRTATTLAVAENEHATPLALNRALAHAQSADEQTRYWTERHVVRHRNTAPATLYPLTKHEGADVRRFARENLAFRGLPVTAPTFPPAFEATPDPDVEVDFSFG